MFFDRVKFGDGDLSFYGANFGNGNVSFKDSYFGDGEVSFARVEFEAGNISFENAKFGNGDILFIDIKFGVGDISFENAKFGEGSFLFRNNKYNEGTISFNKTIFKKEIVSFGNCKFSAADFTFSNVEIKSKIFAFTTCEFKNGNKTFDNSNFNTKNTEFLNNDFGFGDISFSDTFWGNGYTKIENNIINKNLLDINVKRSDPITDISNDILNLYGIPLAFKNIKLKELFITFIPLLGILFLILGTIQGINDKHNNETISENVKIIDVENLKNRENYQNLPPEKTYSHLDITKNILKTTIEITKINQKILILVGICIIFILIFWLYFNKKINNIKIFPNFLEQNSSLCSVPERKNNFIYNEAKERISGILKSLHNTNNRNLFFGIILAISGVGILYYANYKVDFTSAVPFYQQSEFISRVTLGIFIQILSFYFLRLYVGGLSDVKYYQNELTNLEFKHLALQSSLTMIEMSTKNDNLNTSTGEIIKTYNQAVIKLAETERNHILKKGETTVEVLKEQNNSQTISEIGKIIPNIIKEAKS